MAPRPLLGTLGQGRLEKRKRSFTKMCLLMQMVSIVTLVTCAYSSSMVHPMRRPFSAVNRTAPRCIS
jgi:hypothetical protein